MKERKMKEAESRKQVNFTLTLKERDISKERKGTPISSNRKGIKKTPNKNNEEEIDESH
jgi:hypothetical protein